MRLNAREYQELGKMVQEIGISLQKARGKVCNLPTGDDAQEAAVIVRMAELLRRVVTDLAGYLWAVKAAELNDQESNK
jgi:hypothetical protein